MAAATAMFIEVLVVGIGSLAGLVGVVATVVGYDNMKKLAVAGDSTLVSGAAVAFAYALGILSDRAADFILRSKRRTLRAQYFSSNAAYDRARRVVVQFPEIMARSDYARSRMRVCRGWLFNTAILAIVVDLLIIRFPVQNRPILIAAATIIGLLLAAGFYAAWSSITVTGYKKLALQAQASSVNLPVQQDSAAPSGMASQG
ncbi:hypothetical protein ACFWYX_23740 [[Kitasatospora] papulosa]|uniref:hypothetical protein n=1 Tax=[Kitasatospora] papulosa TaxID=1464011 RepID=UPI003689BE58